MNQPQSPMPQNLGPEKPAMVRPWLLIVLLIVILAGAGYFGWQYWTKSKTENPTTTPTTTDATADWKTYTNTDYGYSLKYPTDWALDLNNTVDRGKLFSSAEGHFWITVEDNTKKLDVTGIKNNYYQNDDYGYQYQDSFVKVAGIDAYKQGRYDIGVIEKYYVPKNDKIYSIAFEFNFDTPNQTMKDSQTNLIDQILSTFQFTTPISTADWKTYENKDYGFSFKYPANYASPKVEKNSNDFPSNYIDFGQVLTGKTLNGQMNVTVKDVSAKNGKETIGYEGIEWIVDHRAEKQKIAEKADGFYTEILRDGAVETNSIYKIKTLNNGIKFKIYLFEFPPAAAYDKKAVAYFGNNKYIEFTSYGNEIKSENPRSDFRSSEQAFTSSGNSELDLLFETMDSIISTFDSN